VTTLAYTFYQAGEMNSDLSGWNVAKVTTLTNTFNSASKFTGTGLASWNIAKVTTMLATFTSATSITACNKRQIADAWKSNSAFTTWNTAWAADVCSTPLTDATFKQASWGT
jgi:surface protein